MSDMWEYEEDDEAFEERTQPLRRKRGSAASDSRGNLYLLTGLLIGLGIGLLIAWVISPVTYLDTDPGSLARIYKDEYRQLIAQAYSANGNLERARERIYLIDAGESVSQLAAQAQRMLADNQPPQSARALAVLAADLNQPVRARTAQPTAGAEATVEVAAPTEQNAATLTTLELSAAIQTPTIPLPTRTSTPTLTPVPTFTPRPTATPLPVLDAPFTLKEKREVCVGNIEPGLLQIEVKDKNGEALPGIPVLITWEGGESLFYTGLIPEVSLGYADFVMEKGATYSLNVGLLSQTYNGISIPNCNGNLVMEFNEGD